jgi:phage gpG-like protein
MSSIQIEVSNTKVLAVLARLSSALADPSPILHAWGEDLVESTKQRFITSTGPDGTHWPANTEATYLAYLHRLSGSYSKEGKRTGTTKGWERKDGRIAAKGSAAMQGKKPLIGQGKALSTQIYYHVDGTTLYVGSPEIYAAMQQFGGTKAEFPNLWGDIPARPYLGLSDADVEKMDQTAADYLQSLLNG